MNKAIYILSLPLRILIVFFASLVLITSVAVLSVLDQNK